MKDDLDLNEGYSMNYLVPSFFIIVIGLILFTVRFVPAIVMILIGIVLLLAKTGVLVSVNDNKAMNYKSILNYRFGQSFNLSEYNHVKLKYTNDATLMQSRGSSNVVRAKTYDILLSSLENKEVLLFEFTDYKMAEKTYHYLREGLNYTGTNEFAERQMQMAKRKPITRRR